MKTALTLALALTLAPAAFAVDADSMANAAVAEIGQINGLALACKQPAISSRARNAMVTGAAKTRTVGETFEGATNAAFLKQGKGGTCPDAVTLSRRLDEAEKQLQAAAAAKQ